MRKTGLYGFLLLAACVGCVAQPTERELGDFDLKMAYVPTRSMANGLVSPQSTGSVHGGIDISHSSGLYMGQWALNLDPTNAQALETDSYLGFQHPLNADIGYEVGTLINSYPTLEALSKQYYAGLSLYDSRLGTAFSLNPDREDRTLLADLGLLQPLGFDLVVKYSNHALFTPVETDGGAVGRFTDWSVNVSRPWLGIDLGISYSGSSLDQSQCGAYSGSNPYCDDALMLRASRLLF